MPSDKTELAQGAWPCSLESVPRGTCPPGSANRAGCRRHSVSVRAWPRATVFPGGVDLALLVTAPAPSCLHQPTHFYHPCPFLPTSKGDREPARPQGTALCVAPLVLGRDGLTPAPRSQMQRLARAQLASSIQDGTPSFLPAHLPPSSLSTPQFRPVWLTLGRPWPGPAAPVGRGRLCASSSLALSRKGFLWALNRSRGGWLLACLTREAREDHAQQMASGF